LKNNGQASAGPFYVDLYIDAHRYIHYPFPGLDPGQSSGFPDWAENWPASGWHTITIIVDADGAVTESNEDNNVWTGQFYWQPGHPLYLPLVYR
jgi:subtilase family serine protease